MKNSLIRLMMCGALLLTAHFSALARVSGELPVLPEEVAEQFGDLYINHFGRVCPLQTMARDYCMKAYKKGHYGPYTAEQVVTGWLFHYEWWRGENPDMEVASGQAFNIFPVEAEDGTVEWYNPDSPLPAGLDYDRWLFIRKSLDVMQKEVAAENWDEVSGMLSQIRRYQEKTAGASLPSEGKFAAEKFYNRISRPMVPFMASVTVGIVFFILFGIWTARGRKPRRGLQAGLSVLAGLLLVYLTVVIALRWYVSGTGPFAGGYSVMMLMAWLACIAQLCFFTRFPLIQPLGFLVSGFAMLVASLAGTSLQITSLSPALQSPLLSVHVSSVMISYTLFALVAFNALMGVFLKGNAAGTLQKVSLAILRPAVALLAIGIVLGSIWAKSAWGSYWSWDPKETWALITLIIYSLSLFGTSLKPFRNPRVFHIYTLLAFGAVLLTYFGVNFVFGGLHSYA